MHCDPSLPWRFNNAWRSCLFHDALRKVCVSPMMHCVLSPMNEGRHDARRSHQRCTAIEGCVLSHCDPSKGVLSPMRSLGDRRVCSLQSKGVLSPMRSKGVLSPIRSKGVSISAIGVSLEGRVIPSIMRSHQRQSTAHCDQRASPMMHGERRVCTAIEGCAKGVRRSCSLQSKGVLSPMMHCDPTAMHRVCSRGESRQCDQRVCSLHRRSKGVLSPIEGCAMRSLTAIEGCAVSDRRVCCLRSKGVLSPML